MPNIKRTENGDRFILCRWSFRYGPMIEEQSNSLEWLLGQIPRFLHASDGDPDAAERLSVCAVGHWTYDADNDPSDWTPRDITTLYEIDHYADPAEDDSPAEGAAKEAAHVA